MVAVWPQLSVVWAPLKGQTGTRLVDGSGGRILLVRMVNVESLLAAKDLAE